MRVKRCPVTEFEVSWGIQPKIYGFRMSASALFDTKMMQNLSYWSDTCMVKQYFLFICIIQIKFGKFAE